MREIKFRAWDTKKQMMSGWPIALPLVTELEKVLTFNLKTKDVKASKELIPYLMTKDANTGQWKGTPTSGFILMQYTGLKDKNGVEIYEGDMIAWYNGKKSKNQPPDITGQVFWSEFQLHWALDGKYRHPHPVKDLVSDDTELYKFRSNGRIEIIGNLWENPELLK